MQKTSRTRLLAESAVMIALALVLNFIKFSKLPYGGETTLASMLPILLICIKNGPRWGFLTAFVYSLIQLFLPGQIGIHTLGIIAGSCHIGGYPIRQIICSFGIIIHAFFQTLSPGIC